MYRVNVELRRNRLFATPIAKTGFSSDPASMYVWCYKGSQTFNHLMLAGILLAVLVVCLFPVWPRWGKLGALALAAFTLVALVGSIFARWLLWLVCWLFGYDVWFLPNVFGVGESYAELFLPWWSVEPAPKGDRVYRAATLVAIAAFAYWVYTQPTKFDAFIAIQKEFVTDLCVHPPPSPAAVHVRLPQGCVRDCRQGRCHAMLHSPWAWLLRWGWCSICLPHIAEWR